MSDAANFYLGRIFDSTAGKCTGENLFYDPANLTTHAVITGMTGSGKTGLGIALLEEAALHKIPAIAIDPKGDLTNLLLHFPDLLPADFAPWVDPETARREGKSVEQLAGETAARWKNGLAEWGLGSTQLAALRDSVRFTVYTPGSSSGQPVNILSSFSAPGIPWEENREILRERISSTATALLGLIGLDNIDPLRSREHILLSNIMEFAWSQGRSLDLSELILQVQNPPMQRLGAFPMDSFFPEKDRIELAMLLNNFMASPSFQSWLEGEPLDIAALQYSPEGIPRHNIFYIAHLSEKERMFFVTLFFAAIESWMRAQRGTSGLRSLVYFDEILGYLPPVANPPSRQVMLRMLKQARAFGVGLVLATQNPVDVDYKALSNAGTWMIGRLQTDQDKQRLMDGLQNVSGTADTATLDRMISGLQKRVFLLHSVNSSGPRLFQTRWALNYLAGPMTRSQLPLLRGITSTKTQTTATTTISKPVEPAVKPAPKMAAYSATKPAVPDNVSEYFAPATISSPPGSEGIVYRPAFVVQAETRYIARKYGLEHSRRVTALAGNIESALVRWEDFSRSPIEQAKLQNQPMPQARFAALPGFLTESKRLNGMKKDFIDWVYRNGTIRVKANESLKIYAAPGTTPGAFREMCDRAVQEGSKADIDKATATYTTKLNALRQKIESQKMEVRQQEADAARRKQEELASGGELILGLLTGKKRSLSTPLNKRRMAEAAKSDVEEERQQLAGLEAQVKELEDARDKELVRIREEWARSAGELTEVPVPVLKKDIFIELFGVLWLPYYLVKADGPDREIPAFPGETLQADNK